MPWDKCRTERYQLQCAEWRGKDNDEEEKKGPLAHSLMSSVEMGANFKVLRPPTSSPRILKFSELCETHETYLKKSFLQ